MAPKIQVGTAQEAELIKLVRTKLNEYGWSDDDVLAQFIVVMVANEKSKEDMVEELSDILPQPQGSDFVDWLFATLDHAGEQGGQAPQQPSHDHIDVVAAPQQELYQNEQQQQTMETTTPSSPPTTRQRSQLPSNSHAQGRLLQSAISNATRPSDTSMAASHRPAPSRVYEDQNRRRDPPRRNVSSRDRSHSPVRSRESVSEGLTTRNSNNNSNSQAEGIRFRRTDEERAQDEARIDARLGHSNGSRGGGGGLRGRLGLKRTDDAPARSRERSWDRNNDYHDRRGSGRHNQNNSNNSRGHNNDRDALRNIERRLGSRAVDFDDSNSEDIPSQPASWSRNPERMLRVEAEITRQAVAAESANITRCRFWPNCAQRENCQYWHPKELCTDYPNCPKTAGTCLYIHPLAEPTAEQVAAAARQALMQSMKNRNGGMNGTGAGGEGGGSPILNSLQMPFALGSTPALQDCKFGARCTRADCKFRHPQRTMAGDVGQQQQLCRFFPHCTKPNCPFYHPPYGQPLAGRDTNMDESGATSPSTNNAEGTNRLPTPCRFGDQCTRPGCHFTHPRDGPGADTGAGASTMPICKFNPCTRTGCPFRHVASGGGMSHKTLILNKPTNGTSERFAGGVVDDGEVEKMHVPASTHWANGGVTRQPLAVEQQQELSEAVIQAAEAQALAEMDMDTDMDVII